MSGTNNKTVMGKITSVYGVKGWVKVFSYTQPKENICQYKEWTLEGGHRDGLVKVISCKAHGNGLIAQLDGCNDRDEAKAFAGSLINVSSSELPDLPEGDYYWHQLQGLTVVLHSENEQSEDTIVGQVDHLIETGSNDVLVIKKCSGSIDGKERLIPYLPDQVVKRVDLARGRIVVDWDLDF